MMLRVIVYQIVCPINRTLDFKVMQPKKGGIHMRFQEKIRTILKYVSGLLAAVAIIGLIGTTSSDFLGNISYLQMVLQLVIFSCFMAASLAIYWFIK